MNAAGPSPPMGQGEPLTPELAALVTAFARTGRAAARAIALYPPEHPAVASTLSQVIAAAQQASTVGELRMGILPDAITVDGRRPARVDPAVAELAALLHAHQVGRLTIQPQSDADEWRQFLSLLALPPEQARLRGGLAAIWAREGQRRITVQQIDYAALLRQGISGERVTWDAIVAGCLEGDADVADDWMLDLVLDIVNHPSDVGRLVSAVESRTHHAGGRGPIVIAGLLQAVAQFVAQSQSDHLEPLLVALAEATTHLPLSTLAPMVGRRPTARRPKLGQFVASLARRMTDASIAERVAAEVRDGHGASPLLAEALVGLAPDVNRRATILALARQVLDQAPGAGGATSDAQAHIEHLLTDHDDAPFVSETYATELARVADRAVDLDRDTTDPPARQRAWTDSVSDDRLRQLDAHLLVDLMQLKRDVSTWRELAALAVARINALVAAGDFDAAAFVVEAIRLQHEGHPTLDIRAAAANMFGDVLNPGLMRHVASHLDTSDASAIGAAKRFCHALGPEVVPLLAEVLSREERARPHQHLIAILSAFGAAGRQAVERLMQSSNSAVRRTAVLLLREFGGQEALPELESLLNDREPHVQREATRAIALLGIEAAFDTLTRALSEGTEQARAAITGVLWTLPAEDTAPLLAHIVAKAPLGRSMRAVHERAMQRLSIVGGREAIDAIRTMLHRGSSFTPFQTAAMRRLAAGTLAKIGTPDALDALRGAAVGGSWGARSAARHALARTGQPSPPRSRGER